MLISSQKNIYTALNINAENDEYISIPYHNDIVFNYGKSNSATFWIYTNKIGTQTIYSNINITTGAWVGFSIGLSSTNQVNFNVRKGPSSSNWSGIKTVNTIPINTLTKVDIIYGGVKASTMSIAINDIIQTTTIDSDTLTGTYVNTQPVRIGVTTDFGNSFNGFFHKMKIYNKELILSELNIDSLFGTQFGDSGVSGLNYMCEFDTLNPVDVVGGNNGTSFFQDENNIINVSDNPNNKGLLITSYGADNPNNKGLTITQQ